MSLKQTSKRSIKSFFAYLVILIVFGYFMFLLVSIQIQIAEKKSEYNALEGKTDVLLVENETLERYTRDENLSEYIENIARDKLDLAFPQERIYYIIPAA